MPAEVPFGAGVSQAHEGIQGPVEERELVAAVLRRDRKAAARFVADYTDSVYAYVRHRLAPRADLVDDLVQDVFLAALASLSTFQGTSSLRSWLLGIARHKVESYYRRRLREPDALTDDHPEPTANSAPLDEVIDRERMEERTQQVLKRLPETYGLALLWRYWENRSVRDMAEATGKTDKAVERLLARARARFRELWEQERS
jgi:RNA polymerase sigma-70 factor (ECF subfamily)